MLLTPLQRADNLVVNTPLVACFDLSSGLICHEMNDKSSDDGHRDGNDSAPQLCTRKAKADAYRQASHHESDLGKDRSHRLIDLGACRFSPSIFPDTQTFSESFGMSQRCQ